MKNKLSTSPRWMERLVRCLDFLWARPALEWTLAGSRKRHEINRMGGTQSRDKISCAV